MKRLSRYTKIVVLLALLLAVGTTRAAEEPFAGTMRVDVTRKLGEWKPIWRFFGADEPNYAYMTNGRKLLAELGELSPKRVYFRTHNLLTSGDGTPALKWGSTGVYREGADGKPVYDWTILDRIAVVAAQLELGGVVFVVSVSFGHHSDLAVRTRGRKCYAPGYRQDGLFHPRRREGESNEWDPLEGRNPPQRVP